MESSHPFNTLFHWYMKIAVLKMSVARPFYLQWFKNMSGNSEELKEEIKKKINNCLTDWVPFCVRSFLNKACSWILFGLLIYRFFIHVFSGSILPSWVDADTVLYLLCADLIVYCDFKICSEHWIYKFWQTGLNNETGLLISPESLCLLFPTIQNTGA